MDAEAWDERYAASELVWSAGPNQFVAAELADLPPGRALDLAAGEGRNAIWLAAPGLAGHRGRLLPGRPGQGPPSSAGRHRRRWVCADATTWRGRAAYDLVLVAYLQLPAEERRAAVRRATPRCAPGGTFLLVAHDSTNLTEGTGGPQDPAVLMTAEDVLADLGGAALRGVRAERVARGSRRARRGSRPAAWDCLVAVVRRG